LKTPVTAAFWNPCVLLYDKSPHFVFRNESLCILDILANVSFFKMPSMGQYTSKMQHFPKFCHDVVHFITFRDPDYFNQKAPNFPLTGWGESP